MGLDVVLECENHFEAGPRHKIAHLSRHSSRKIEERNTDAQLRRKYGHLRRLDGDFKELILSNSSSPRRKSMPSRPPGVNVKDSEVLKRGSMYQSSREVRRMRKLREGKRNVESALSDEAFLSFEIVDSLPLPSSNDAVVLPRQKRSPLVSLNADPKSPSVDTIQSAPAKSMEFLELSFRDLPEECSKLSASCSGSTPAINNSADSLLEICLNSKEVVGKVGKPKSNRNQMIGADTDGGTNYERETKCSLPKSFSAKVGLSSSPCQSEREASKASPKTRFSPFRRMFDPIMKSKSMRNPSLMETETGGGGSTAISPPSEKRHRMFRKSLLNDFAKATEKVDLDGGLTGRDQALTTRSSPAHLHAVLKVEGKHGAPSYEFNIKDPEDVISAQTWRTDSPFNWVYTFHSCKKKSNSSGWGAKDRYGQSASMVGQMQVSCYLCSEVSDNGALDNSTLTEFILYDIAQARRSLAVEEKSQCPPVFTVAESLVSDGPSEENSPAEMEKYQRPVKRTSSDCDSDLSTSYPWAPADLHPHLELAAVVIQIPFNKKEGIKDTGAKETSDKEYPNLSAASATDEGNAIFNCMTRANVKVVTPSGTHGLPNTEEGRPSSLLDRWRLGGGCDCGGWDMSCPIVVFDNQCDDNVTDHSAIGSHRPMVLFVQGRKETIPAVSITADGKGQYLVDFHAQLSSLQAFSICIAILHSSEASSAIGQDKSRQMLYSHSLKLILEEEVRHLIEAVAEEEKRKVKKRVEQVPSSFFLDPPFSPMGRV